MRNKVPFMDLKRQTETLKTEIFQRFDEVCSLAAFSGSDCVKNFETKFAAYLGTDHFAAVSNGSDALMLSLRALGIGRNDEVITPASTYISTIFSILRTGAKPIIADCDPLYWQIDPVSISKLITSRTKAVVGVHLYGQCFDIDSVKKLCDTHNLLLIEDCAQSQGTLYRGRTVGTFGRAGCFSFYPSKTLGAWGDAGGICMSKAVDDERVRVLRNQGSLNKYHHSEIGYNMRMDGLQAEVLCIKLKYLDEWIRKNASIYARYRQYINNSRIQFQAERDESRPAWYVCVVCVDDRERFMRHMEERDITCAIHYPVPCHLQPALRMLGGKRGDCPVAENQAERCVSLPLFPYLTEEEICRVIDACNEY